MKITSCKTSRNFKQNAEREVLRYKYLNQDYSIQSFLTLDKNTKEFISYDTFTPEKPHYDDLIKIKNKKEHNAEKKHKPGEEFITKYLHPDLKTVFMEVKYRWLEDDDYEVVNITEYDI